MKMLARLLARPVVVDWLIRRAQRTPYTHIYKNDELYMERYWLFNPYPVESSGQRPGLLSSLPSIRLHKIMRPDQDRHLHDHPWNARTFILRGHYCEMRSDGEYRGLHAGDTATIRFGEYHAITSISEGGVWTLFVTGKYRGTWGFLVNGVKVQWRTYLGLKGKE